LFGIGGWELLVIGVVALIVLGPKGLPSAARAIGKVAQQLRRATQELRETIELDPDLKELPKTLDELNRPFISPTPKFSPKIPPRPKDQPTEDELSSIKERRRRRSDETSKTPSTDAAAEPRSDEPVVEPAGEAGDGKPRPPSESEAQKKGQPLWSPETAADEEERGEKGT